MKKYLRMLVLLGAFSQTGCATRLAEWAVDVERWRSNLEEKRIKVGEFDIAYLEGGEGPTALLIHGFGGDKEHWTRFARQLTDRYHVIAIDLPGFGDSSRLDGYSYAPKEQAERIEQLRVAMRLEKMHLVGNSMGGMIAGVYAREHQDQVLSLTLIDSGGIRSPERSELSRELEKGRNPLVVETREDMDKLLDFNFHSKPFIPSVVVDHIYEKSFPRREWNRRIFKEIENKNTVVEDALPHIQVPILVLWGDKDRVINVSATETVKKVKPEAEIKILADCGHAPMIERVDETAEIFLEFLQRRVPS
ncbi:alpha/beta fold hydrolase [Oligoflexus tunisiensis]|uniref:alpha/beta fold hydrolase n=1 Tax=Oligoflexus tunisiensis TaxID=708132 RepID=UPI00114CB013|nr:alpha/beta hydrolase [Oligoflexus tunisiensis]